MVAWLPVLESGEKAAVPVHGGEYLRQGDVVLLGEQARQRDRLLVVELRRAKAERAVGPEARVRVRPGVEVPIGPAVLLEETRVEIVENCPGLREGGQARPFQECRAFALPA